MILPHQYTIYPEESEIYLEAQNIIHRELPEMAVIEDKIDIEPVEQEKALESQINANNEVLQGEIKELVIEKAKEIEVDPHLALAIIECESGFKRYAKNQGSSAFSYFQFIDSTWEWTIIRMGLPSDTKKSDIPEGIEAGLWLLKQDGTRHWNESKNCWENKINLSLLQ